MTDMILTENKQALTTKRPLILAPAGRKDSFLAAIAAGADAVYCGLKNFSARMEAKNFTIEELSCLTQLAHDKDVKVYVALNSLVKQGELDKAARLLEKLQKNVNPDAIIINDLSFVHLAKQTGFSGELHFSTLANISFGAALKLMRPDLGISRIVIPRELGIDEIKSLASACPQGLELEMFVHGALCYGISGRCYWSSFLGGKSGLRGRCVQPCRRLYTQNEQTGSFFSCKDLSLDVLLKVLLNIQKIRALKIEGRKKGPHYVFYTVKAYRILRDYPTDPKMKKEAIQLLAQSLGRKGTHFYFLPQRPQNPVNDNDQTGSGLFLGKTKGSKQKPYLNPREALLAGDNLRLGYEDEPWHTMIKLNKYVPKKGRLYLKPSSRFLIRKETPVFLIDRREQALDMLLSELNKELLQKKPDIKKPDINVVPVISRTKFPKRRLKRIKPFEIYIYRNYNNKKVQKQTGFWTSGENLNKSFKGVMADFWWWLPPVIWPEEESRFQTLVKFILKNKGRNFVLNAPWQIALFKNPEDSNLWAGPFCNIANTLAINSLSLLGFKGVIISPELSRDDYFAISTQSPLPLGIVISGTWPICVTRIMSENLKTETLFKSPKGEQAWVRKNGSNYFIYPNWKLDITAHKKELERAGFCMFVHLIEPLPEKVKLKKRPGLWNWDLNLL